MPTALILRDPRLWSESDRFRPERWLGDEAPSPFHFPFGGGARRCVGEPLPMAEVRTVVPVILRELCGPSGPTRNGWSCEAPCSFRTAACPVTAADA